MNEQITDFSPAVIIITKNEQDNIRRCLDSLNWCNEIIVIDDYSTDNTLKIVRSIQKLNANIRVFSRLLNGDFAGQRNFALSKANSNWALFVDADETVSGSLKKEILQTLSNQETVKVNGYFLKRSDIFFGKTLKYGETAALKFMRLARIRSGLWQGRVHEEWNIEGRTGNLENHLIHTPHKNMAAFLNSINKYTDIVAQYWIEQGRKSDVWQIIFYPLLKFISNYFFKLGFLDGTRGLIMSIMMSFHSFLVRGKVYLKQQL